MTITQERDERYEPMTTMTLMTGSELIPAADTCRQRIPGRAITCQQPLYRDCWCYFHHKRHADLLGPAPAVKQ